MCSMFKIFGLVIFKVVVFSHFNQFSRFLDGRKTCCLFSFQLTNITSLFIIPNTIFLANIAVFLYRCPYDRHAYNSNAHQHIFRTRVMLRQIRTLENTTVLSMKHDENILLESEIFKEYPFLNATQYEKTLFFYFL